MHEEHKQDSCRKTMCFGSLKTPFGEVTRFYRREDGKLEISVAGKSILLTQAELIELDPARSAYISKPFEFIPPPPHKEVLPDKSQKALEEQRAAQQIVQNQIRAELELKRWKKQQKKNARDASIRAQRRAEEDAARLALWQERQRVKALNQQARDKVQAELEAIQRRNNTEMNIVIEPEQVITEESKQRLQNLLKTSAIIRAEEEKTTRFWNDPSRQWAD